MLNKLSEFTFCLLLTLLLVSCDQHAADCDNFADKIKANPDAVDRLWLSLKEFLKKPDDYEHYLIEDSVIVFAGEDKNQLSVDWKKFGLLISRAHLTFIFQKDVLSNTDLKKANIHMVDSILFDVSPVKLWFMPKSVAELENIDKGREYKLYIQCGDRVRETTRIPINL